MDSQRDLRELGAHSDERREPHPEYGSGTAYNDSSGNAGDVSGTDCGCKRCSERLKRCYFSFAGCVLLEHLAEGVLHGITELAELKEPGADGEDQSYAYQKAEHHGTPCDVV